MLELIQLGDYFGTFVFALTGGLAAAEKRLDLSGFLLLAFITGVGGGTMRDLILNRDLVFWTHEPIYIVICMVGGVIPFFAAHRLPRLHATLVWGDAIGLAVFAVIGSGIALKYEYGGLVAVLMGVLTAIGGGVLREMIRNEMPLILRREIYISAVFAGSVGLVVLMKIGAPVWAAVVTGAIVTFLMRGAGIVFDLHMPMYVDPRPTRAEGASDGDA